MRSFFLYIIILMSLHFSGFSDTIFGPVSEIQSVEGEGDLVLEQAIKCYELLFIKPGENTQFLKGIQLEVILSDNLKRYAENLALDIYINISPSPTKDHMNYKGERIFAEVIPNVNRFYINIPFGDHRLDLSSSLNTFDITRNLNPDSYPLLMTLQPIIKGVPNKVLQRPIYTIIKPIVEEKGILNLRLKKDEEIDDKDFDILIDNISYSVKEVRNLILSSGIHQVSINSDIISPQITNFTINAGKTTELELLLDKTNTTITFDLIEGAIVYLNGNLIKYKPGVPQAVEEGLNTLIIKIGKQKITKKIDVKSGKNYNISLILELEVKES